ncbi:MAG: hypothetical protein HZA21_05640 [Nitrospirae bacterium]|nr:hypothetical protein [Nitrospirota bacterium]
MLALALALTLVTLAPFAAALEVHHELAAADQDGHQHSDTDLCQWVQHHTGHSLDIVAPAVERFLDAGLHRFPPPATLLSVSLISSTPSRAPPLS